MLGILGLPIPDETLLMFAGYLVSQGNLQFQPTMATAFLGSVCGISLSYLLEWWVGPPFVKKCERIFHLHPGALDRAKIWYQWKGNMPSSLGTIFSGYAISRPYWQDRLDCHCRRLVCLRIQEGSCGP